MSVTMLDIHIKNVLEFGLKTIRSNPDKHLTDIFGDFRLDPHAALYGNRLIALVKNWLTKTDVPIVLGFDLSSAKMPAVTINLTSTEPSQTYMGDFGGIEFQDLPAQQRDVIIPEFKVKSLDWNSDSTALILEPLSDMPMAQREMFIPGLILLDDKNREYSISQDIDGNILIIEAKDTAPLSDIGRTEFQVVSPALQARYKRGHMLMNETATIAVHGHTDRNEGLWLYYITMWIILKYRPLMIETFGLDLAMPMASDFSKDDSTLGTNTWRRFIQLSAKSVWTWESARQADVYGLLLSISSQQANLKT